MLREYEFTMIAKAEMPDGERAKLLDTYENLFKKDGGEILRKEDWGAKKMAYPIKKCFRGHYFFYNLASKSEHIIEAQRLLRFDDNVLRYLVVKSSDDVDVTTRKEELANAALVTEEA